MHVEDAPATLDPILECASIEERGILSEKAFRRAIAVERKRTERSRKPFLLMLVEAGSEEHPTGDSPLLEKLASILIESSRETDIVGWYRTGANVGAMFTSLVLDDRELIRSTILARLSSMLESE